RAGGQPGKATGHHVHLCSGCGFLPDLRLFRLAFVSWNAHRRRKLVFNRTYRTHSTYTTGSMIRSILFPTDFSAVANSAFPLAVALAAQFDAIVHSVHISHGGDPHITETSRYEFPGLPTGSSTVRVIEAIIPKGDEDPAQVIMRHAAERVCDLIVMASHGRSDVAQFFLGRSV